MRSVWPRIVAAVEVSAFFGMLLAFAGAIEATLSDPGIEGWLFIAMAVCACTALAIVAMVLEGRVFGMTAWHRPGRTAFVIGALLGLAVALGVAVVRPADSLLGDAVLGLTTANVAWALTVPPRKHPADTEPAGPDQDRSVRRAARMRVTGLVLGGLCLTWFGACAGPGGFSASDVPPGTGPFDFAESPTWLGWLLPSTPATVGAVDVTPDGANAYITYELGCLNRLQAVAIDHSTPGEIRVRVGIGNYVLPVGACAFDNIGITRVRLDPPIDVANPPHVIDTSNGHDFTLYTVPSTASIRRAQFSADGRQLILTFAMGRCDVADTPTVERPADGSIRVSVTLRARGPQSCTAGEVLTEKSVELVPPIDPAHPPLVTDRESGRPISATVDAP